MDIYTLLYFEWATNRDLLYSKGNQLSVMAAWVGGSFGGEWTRLRHMAESLRCATTMWKTAVGHYTFQHKIKS